MFLTSHAPPLCRRLYPCTCAHIFRLFTTLSLLHNRPLFSQMPMPYLLSLARLSCTHLVPQDTSQLLDLFSTADGAAPEADSKRETSKAETAADGKLAQVSLCFHRSFLLHCLSFTPSSLPPSLCVRVHAPESPVNKHPLSPIHLRLTTVVCVRTIFTGSHQLGRAMG